MNGGRRAAWKHESTTRLCVLAVLVCACGGRSERSAGNPSRDPVGGSTSGSAGTANAGSGGESARGGGGVGTAGAADDGEWRCEGTPTPCSMLDDADCFGAECKFGACLLDGDPCGSHGADTCNATEGCSCMSVRDGPGIDDCRADILPMVAARNVDACAENYCRGECYGGW